VDAPSSEAMEEAGHFERNCTPRKGEWQKKVAAEPKAADKSLERRQGTELYSRMSRKEEPQDLAI
jgi:hypothetical protein